ncbi:MAG: ribosome silencing factor [Blastocatellia bacterium]|nr:ribosome silencing factor [Blastocatellia bacterium]
MEEAKELSLNREEATTDVVPKVVPFDSLDESVQLAVRCIDEKKGLGIVVLDLREIASFTEFFVIASGTNQRQVQAIADEIDEQLKKQLKTKAVRVEGYNAAEWVLVDYGDFVVHIFDKEARDYYDLERLWRDAGRVTLPETIGNS